MMSGNILYVNFLFKKLHVNNGFQTIRALQKWSELAWQLVSLRLVGLNNIGRGEAFVIFLSRDTHRSALTPCKARPALMCLQEYQPGEKEDFLWSM